MNVRDVAKTLGLEVLTGEVNLDREVRGGYTSDLLSDVIGNIEEGSAWITIQRHINILGVAKLKDVPVIIISRGLSLEGPVLAKACEEGVAILRGSASAFELSGLLYKVLEKG